MIWKYKDFRIYYKRKLDGGGRILARPFVEFIKNNPDLNKRYAKAFEWCSGPGFIGFALLAEGVCDKLCLVDVNPLAIDCIKKTVEKNNLQEKVSYHLSDNLKDMPTRKKFDLVVSNPPNYCNINSKHKWGKLRKDIRPSDPGWGVHKEFYSTIRPHLNKNATLLISEVEPFKTEVFIPASSKIPYETRLESPINEFKRMIRDGGLSFIGAKQYHDYYGLGLWMIASKK